MSQTLIDRLLVSQADLSAVERFARKHGEAPADGFTGRRHEDLIPFSRPSPGEQYAFAVDLDRCTGCKACVAGCHSLNGLEEDETWREVGLLLGGSIKAPRQQMVTSACHHCAEPGCLEGCPVLAYEKDRETGIVRHLDDQCIGCQYCVLKCPYEAPKYSKRLGIVRKCDMCQSRLAVGEAPACAQACPTQAISIRIISRGEIEAQATNRLFLPDSPDPRVTQPATVYSSARPLSERVLAANHYTPTVQPAHTPLAIMLVFTQAGVGLLAGTLWSSDDRSHLALGTGFILAGLLASVLHLGQPLKAWRVFLGWRTSWLSREILVLGGLGGLSVAALGARILAVPAPVAALTLGAAVIVGLLGVVCSAWVYHDTARHVWRGPFSFGRFLWTTGLFALWAAGLRSAFAWSLACKLLLEAMLALRGWGSRQRLDDLTRSAVLLRGPLGGWLLIRLALGTAALLAIGPSASLSFFCALSGELIERSLFFRAGVAAKMPGMAQ